MIYLILSIQCKKKKPKSAENVTYFHISKLKTEILR